MEEVAVMLSSNVNNDEDSGETLKSDGHVESEEDILNKYVDENTVENKNGLPDGRELKENNCVPSLHDERIRDGDIVEDMLLDEEDDTILEEMLPRKGNNDHQETSSSVGMEMVNGGTEGSGDEKIEKGKLTNGGVVDGDKDAKLRHDKYADLDEKIADDKKIDNDNVEDGDDLLCVMDEKSVEEANENKDENSCNASEKENEDSNDQNDNIETFEANHEENDETKEDEEEITEDKVESPIDIDMEASECAMDIEDSDIGGVMYTDTRIVSTEQLDDGENKIDNGDKDANKENEHRGEITADAVILHGGSIVDNILRNSNAKRETLLIDANIRPVRDEEEQEKENPEKSAKRQLDTSSEIENTKKIKLHVEEIEKPAEKERRVIKILDSFEKFMLDKKLKKLSRFDLEELCVQKMCECIVNKSEIAELKQRVTIQEQAIDTWRKEAVVVAKQTRDLKIVHERLMADLRAMKEQTGKPLVPVKITRSVGLQAVIENPTRIRPQGIMNGTPQQQQQKNPVVVNANLQQNKNASPSPARQPIKAKAVQPPRMHAINNKPLQMKVQENNVAKPKQQASASPQQQTKKNAGPKGVIDLTDEEEKNQNNNTKQSINTGSPTVRMLNKPGITTKTAPPQTSNPQPSKIMFVSSNILQRNSAVMVKMNSNALVSSQNNVNNAIPNGQVSVVTTPVVRTVSQVNVPISSVSTVRTTTPKQVYKHPAPLPSSPNYLINLPGKKPVPPKPHLKLTKSLCDTGIVLQWKMPYKLEAYETIVSYQLYAYQETKSPPKTDNWGKIGDVKALELPMAVTLTQFAVGNRYFFAVRAVDLQKRLGPFSDPENILL